MNYLVMECHEAYAILMDEESRFFHAANLHYTVGQTVTSPILMQQETAAEQPEERSTSARIRRIVMRVSAAAACLVLAAGAGYFHYVRHYKPESVVVLNSDANIKMYLNKEGKVVKLKSENQAGDALLESYDGLRKNKVTVAHELLALQIASGSISDGDTVDVYISAQDADAYDTFKTEFESDISKLNLHVNVQDLTEHPEVTAITEPVVKPEPETPPEKPEKPKKPEKPEKPAVEPGQTPPAKPEEHKKPEGREKAETLQPPKPADPQKPVAEPPAVIGEQPAAPDPANQEAPKPAAPEQNPKAEDAPKPDKPDPEAEPVKPVDPKHADTPDPAADPLHGDKAAKPEHPAPPHAPEAHAAPAPLPAPDFA